MKILVGIPSIRQDPEFIRSMEDFLPKLQKKYEVKVIEVRNNLIAEARNIITDFFLESDNEYLLFLDDDHSGHMLEMFEAILKPLVENKEYICAMKCYTRVFPHMPNLMDYNTDKLKNVDPERIRYKTKGLTSGYAYCNLVGFGMTLIKRGLFDLIKSPYFVGQDNWKEDNYFCDLIQSVGVRPIGCFDYVLTHNGVDDLNVEELNEAGLNKMFDGLKQTHPEIDPLQFKEMSIIA